MTARSKGSSHRKEKHNETVLRGHWLLDSLTPQGFTEVALFTRRSLKEEMVTLTISTSRLSSVMRIWEEVDGLWGEGKWQTTLTKLGLATLGVQLKTFVGCWAITVRRTSTISFKVCVQKTDNNRRKARSGWQYAFAVCWQRLQCSVKGVIQLVTCSSYPRVCSWGPDISPVDLNTSKTCCSIHLYVIDVLLKLN